VVNHGQGHTNHQASIRKARAHNGDVRRRTKRVGETFLFGRAENGGFFNNSVSCQPLRLGLAQPQANRIAFDSQFHGSTSQPRLPDEGYANSFLCRDRGRALPIHRIDVVNFRARNHDRKYNRNRHDSGNDVQRPSIRTIDFAQMRNQQRPKGAGAPPGRQHESIDRTDIPGTKIISGKCRHRAESASVAHQDNERDDRHQRSSGDIWKEPEEEGLKDEHNEKGRPSGNQVRNPGPKDSPNRVADAGQADHAGRRGRGYGCQLLKDWRLLRDDRNSRARIEKQQQPERIKLPGFERFAQGVVVPGALRRF